MAVGEGGKGSGRLGGQGRLHLGLLARWGGWRVPVSIPFGLVPPWQGVDWGVGAVALVL